MQKSSKHLPIVVDANLAVWAVVPMEKSNFAIELFSAWGEEGSALYAPALWLPESISAIRQYVYAGIINSEMGDEAITGLFELEVETIESNELHCRKALQWADKLGQPKAYDGFYVALADELNALLYTGDRRLANAANQAGADWVKLVPKRK